MGLRLRCLQIHRKTAFVLPGLQSTTESHRILTALRPPSPKCVCALQWPGRARNSMLFKSCVRPEKSSPYIPYEGILTPEIRFPVIPLLRLELPKTGKPRSNSYAFSPKATSFKIVLESQGEHS